MKRHKFYTLGDPGVYIYMYVVIIILYRWSDCIRFPSISAHIRSFAILGICGPNSVEVFVSHSYEDSDKF